MRFHATLQLGGKTATGIAVPAEVVDSLGAGKRPPVRVSLGDYTFRTTIAPRGGEFRIPISAEVRSRARVAAGDALQVDIEHDTEPRQVDVPLDLLDAFGPNEAAKRFFESLSYSNQRAYVLWIEDAKKDETRTSRVTKAVAMLSEGQTR